MNHSSRPARVSKYLQELYGSCLETGVRAALPFLRLLFILLLLFCDLFNHDLSVETNLLILIIFFPLITLKSFSSPSSVSSFRWGRFSMVQSANYRLVTKRLRASESFSSSLCIEENILKVKLKLFRLKVFTFSLQNSCT